MEKVEQGILKNVDKFNDIKLAKGLDLTFCATKDRKINWQKVGISTETFGDKWILTPKGRGLFKSFDTFYSTSTKNIRICNELLCRELCKQVGIRCAEYELAEIDGIKGLITYDFVGKNKLVPLNHFVEINKQSECNLIGCVEAFDTYAEKGYIFDKKQAIIDLFKLIVFDTLTLQTDRHENNVNFLFEKGKKISVATLFDNEFAFCGERLLKWVELERSKNMTFSDILSEHVLESKIFTFDDEYVMNTKRLYNNLKNIAFYAKKHQTLKTTLKNMLDNINPTKAFIEIKKQGAIVNPYYQNFVTEIIQNAKDMIKNHMHMRVYKQELADAENIY